MVEHIAGIKLFSILVKNVIVWWIEIDVTNFRLQGKSINVSQLIIQAGMIHTEILMILSIEFKSKSDSQKPVDFR